MSDQVSKPASKVTGDRRTFTLRETLRAKYGYDEAAKMIRAMYDRTVKPKKEGKS